MNPEPEWIAPEAVRMFHHRQLAEHGGIAGTRDEGMLLSCLTRPAQLWRGGDPPPALSSLAAAYASGFAMNRPFLDGNKRAAAIACELFLHLNGIILTVEETEKHPHYLALAAGAHSEDSFAAWLRTITARESAWPDHPLSHPRAN